MCVDGVRSLGHGDIVPIRVGHAYAEYAVHADCVHMHEYAYADENLIHIIHV